MNKVGVTAYGAAAVAILLVSAQDVYQALLWLHDYSSGTRMFALGLGGWAVATFLPFALSLGCWRLTRRSHARWALHLVFIPCAYGIVRGGAELLFIAARPYGDEPVDYALLSAFLLLALTVLVHTAALIVEIVAAVRRRAIAHIPAPCD